MRRDGAWRSRARQGMLVLAALLGSLLLPTVLAEAGDNSPASAAPKALRVVSDDNYPPYLFRNSEGTVEGYLVDLWQLWGRKNGIEVRLTATNWASAQQMLLGGRADVIDMMFRTPAREALYDFSAPYAELPVAIYSHSSISGISGISTLKGFQVGVQAGDACIDRLVEQGISDLVEFRNYADLLAAAQRREIKVFCLDEYPGDYYLYQDNVQSDFIKAFELYRGRFHRAVRKGNVDVLALVEQGMRAISADEEATLRRKWFGTPLRMGVYGRYFAWGLLLLLAAGSLLLLWNHLLRRQVVMQTGALNRTLLELEQAHRSTKEVQDHLAATLQAIPDLLFEFDAAGHYVAVFASQEKLLAEPKSDLIGKPVASVLPDDAAQTVLEALAGAVEHGSDYGRVISLVLGGKRHWFELSATRKPSVASAPPTVLLLSRDITRRCEAEQALRQASEAALLAERDKHFRILFNAAPVALGYLKGTAIEAVNQRFVELFGYRADDFLGIDTWWELAYPDQDYRRRVQAGWTAAVERAAAAGGRVDSLEYRVASKDGKQLDLLIGGQLIDDGLIVTFVDISPFKQAEAALQKAREVADAANAAKSNFLANMSHEIRTPMNAILGYTYLLGKGELSPEQKERLGRIEDAGQHLLAIINDILDLSKIDAGKLVLDQRDFSLGDIVDHVRSLIDGAASAKGLSVDSECVALDSTLQGDLTRLRQCLLNLASNAVKFTEAGAIAIRVRLVERDGESLLLRFEVQDSGIGVPAASLGELFQPFKQLDASTTRRYGGTGLGLAITRRMASLMGGEAGAESEVGNGSTFWFTARLRQGRALGVEDPLRLFAGSSEMLIRQRYPGARILLVEDDPVNQQVVLELLGESGLRIDVAGNGRQAVDMAGASDYKLILMDIQMPEMSGLQATEAIRAIPERQATPIIAMTASAFDEDRRNCMQAGVSDFIAKPVDPDVFFQALLRWLGTP